MSRRCGPPPRQEPTAAVEAMRRDFTAYRQTNRLRSGPLARLLTPGRIPATPCHDRLRPSASSQSSAHTIGREQRQLTQMAVFISLPSTQRQGGCLLTKKSHPGIL